MLELLLEIIFSGLFEGLFALIFGVAEYASYRTHKRIWMWILGFVGIGLMIWWRGPAFWTTWALGAGWLAALVWLDRRMTASAEVGRAR